MTERLKRLVDGVIVDMTPEEEADHLASLPQPVPPDLTALARQRRWEREIGGISFNGVAIATDDRSKTMILGSRIAAMADPDWTASWAAADGGTYPIDASTIIAISDAVQAHVNLVFAVFDTVKTAIEAGTITTREQIDAAFEM